MPLNDWRFDCHDNFVFHVSLFFRKPSLEELTLCGPPRPLSHAMQLPFIGRCAFLNYLSSIRFHGFVGEEVCKDTCPLPNGHVSTRPDPPTQPVCWFLTDIYPALPLGTIHRTTGCVSLRLAYIIIYLSMTIGQQLRLHAGSQNSSDDARKPRY